MELVPDRECGECTACCHHIPINQDDFVKLANVRCVHLSDGGGCSIYETRPATCAGWYCAWRYLPGLGDNWRPDNSGVLMDFTTDLIPEEYQGKKAIVLKVIDKEKFFKNNQLTQYVMQIVEREMPIFLAFGLDPGYTAASIFLNNQLQEAARTRDYAAVGETLKWALEECDNAPKNAVEIEDGRIVTISNETGQKQIDKRKKQ